ncbi:heat shock protein 30D-like [Pieris rapae]|uniref:heat shock protein 30D-like n=1 Tax=Pieris rapae TaxID=64459 RepID=UPI001E27BB1B|nr:heat shock protein 30D-like [Pieris rapae]
MSEKQLQPQINIPIEITDLPLFDGSVQNIKDTFVSEMKRIDEEMTKFSTNILGLYGQTDTTLTTSKDTGKPPTWDSLATSSLIEGEGENRVIKLQFDLSGFDPTEVNVSVTNNLLQVTATHEFKTDTSSTLKEYRREFHLPHGVNPERIVSSLTKEGVLLVQAPLPPLESLAIK